MIKIVILGSAAGGGLPQWNCGCENCRAARGAPDLRASQASIAISGDGEHWFLINAAPDLRQQITDTPVLHPRALRHSPIAGVILTNGEVDAVTGLLSLREGSPFALYAHERVHGILRANSIFNALNPDKVARVAIETGVVFEPKLPDGSGSGLLVEPFVAPGKTALYLEGAAENDEGDTLGLRITRDGKVLVFLAACAAVTPEVAKKLDGADLVFFDGTLWRDDELIALGLGQKTGQRMGHIAMDVAMPALGGLRIGRKVFLHINNSNPAWRHDAPERGQAEQAGWIIPADGMEMTL
ncbi:MAG TPA: pyrroloquinoline quinone biosynthesis protein PqqB [Devosia sp.]|nr:pyrroloquinoline quinone biosynthesis protein PqqB [Devosia sp.]